MHAESEIGTRSKRFGLHWLTYHLNNIVYVNMDCQENNLVAEIVFVE